MSNQLLPCPFCGGDANAKPHSQHLPGCYFDAMAALKAAPKGDLSMAPEVVRAWNRRSTRPASGEPVAINVNYADEVDLIRAVLEGYPPSIARTDALCSVKLLKAYFSAPPAAAHEDEPK